MTASTRRLAPHRPDCRRAALLAAALAAAAALAPAPAAARAQCRTFTCTDTFYYATADKDRVVGAASTCPGRKGRRGRVTRFFDRETDTYRQCSQVPDKFPCEFLPGGCRPIPTPR